MSVRLLVPPETLQVPGTLSLRLVGFILSVPTDTRPGPTVCHRLVSMDVTRKDLPVHTEFLRLSCSPLDKLHEQRSHDLKPVLKSNVESQTTRSNVCDNQGI